MSENDEKHEIGLPPGTKVGKYEIIERIGVGGQAIVYKGYDPLLDRTVAIKQISSHLAGDERFVQRFRREAQILARIGGERANIVSVFDLLEDPHGLFIVLEFVRGHTLKRVLSHQRYAIPVPAALEILWNIAKGLKAAHDAGIVHRDLKPGNVLITPDYSAKITDFGVAAQAGSEDSLALGTTKYMAPEMFEKAVVDCRADLYSLGFIAYEMLTGRDYFDRLFADVVSDPHTEHVRWMKWHIDMDKNVPPLMQINPRVPKELSEIVERLMAKSAAARFASADELLSALREHFAGKRYQDGRFVRPGERIEKNKAGELVLTDPDAPDRDEATRALPARPASPKMRLAVAAIVAVLLVGGGLALATVAHRQAAAKRNDAARLYDKARKDFQAAEALYGQSGASPEALAAFAGAETGFGKLRDERFRGLEAARFAAARAELARAWQARLKGEWDAADTHNSHARAMGLTEDETETFGKRLMFRQGATKDLELAAAAIKARDLDKATIHLNTFGEIPPAFQPADLKLRADDLNKTLAEARRQGQFDRLIAQGDDAMARADRQIDEGQFDRAVPIIDEAAKAYAAAKDVMDNPAVAAKIADAAAGTRYLAARKFYQQAVTDGDVAAEIESLKAVVAARPVEKYQKLLARTQAEEALARGQKLRQAGRVKNLEDAQAAVAESLGFDQLDEAIKARDELVTELRRARFAADGEARMVEGQDAVTAGKFPQAAAAFKAAVEAFTQAIAVTDGNDMQDRLAEAKVRIEMTAAAAARQEQKWEDALAAYERVRQVRPDDPNFVQMADQGNTMVAREREFFKQYNEGLSALEARQYSKAINRLGRAVEIAKELDVPHEQAAAKHLEAMYLWDMDKGEQARTSGDLVTALAHFRQAQKRMDTPDVREKIAVVEAALKKD
jgi:tetratricopeptide (TPR) repeat protein